MYTTAEKKSVCHLYCNDALVISYTVVVKSFFDSWGMGNDWNFLKKQGRPAGEGRPKGRGDDDNADDDTNYVNSHTLMLLHIDINE